MIPVFRSIIHQSHLLHAASGFPSVYHTRSKINTRPIPGNWNIHLCRYKLNRASAGLVTHSLSLSLSLTARFVCCRRRLNFRFRCANQCPTSFSAFPTQRVYTLSHSLLLWRGTRQEMVWAHLISLRQRARIVCFTGFANTQSRRLIASY